MISLVRVWQALKSALEDWWWSVDHVLFYTFCTLIAAGLLLSLATSPSASASNHFANPFHYFSRHLVFAIAGFSGMVAISLFDPVSARRFAILVLIGSLAAMMFILFAGYEAKGAQRWLRLGAFSLQPSEFLKPAFIVTAAWLFSRPRAQAPLARLSAFAIYALIVVLLMKQPDLGQTILISISFFLVFFFSGISWRWIVGLGIFSLASLYGAFAFFPYVAARVQHFIAPSGDGNSQTDRALQALTGGGLFGRGPGEGIIKKILPEAHTDYIFSVAVEEYGTLAALIIIALFAVIVLRGFVWALRLTDQSEQLAVAGLSTLIGLQAAINIAVNLHISPPEGMTLPFLSYGGSSLLAMGLTAGLLLAFTRRRPGGFE